MYCLLDVEPWREATAALDERVWVECDRAVARERLVRRHLKEGVEYEQDKAEARGESVVNAAPSSAHVPV